MKDSSFTTSQDPYLLLERALREGWHDVVSIPLASEGNFMVVTLKGLIRLARNRSEVRLTRRADGWGPKRATVVSVETGNYLGAIAWRRQ